MIEIFTISFVTSLVLTLLAMPWLIRFSLSHGYYDRPNDRKIHDQVVPRIGGVVFLPSSIIALIASTAVVSEIYGLSIEFDSKFLYQLLAVIVIFAVGVVDDLKGLPYKIKFVAQFLSGILLCLSGVYLSDFHGVLGLGVINPVLGWCITVFAVIYCTNAINFIDGVDGQASSIALTAMIYYAFLLSNVEPVYAIFAVVVAGAVLAFMRYNILGNTKRKTKTFMGDTGSLYLGLVMVVLGVYANEHSMSLSTSEDTRFIYAFAPLFLPCLDVVRVVLHRVRMGESPFAADKNHIHHKFLVMGISQHKVSFIVSMLNVVVIALSCALGLCFNANLVMMILLVVWTIFNIYLSSVNMNKIKN